MYKRTVGTRAVYFVNKEEKCDLVDGFYPIQIAIYNGTRVALYKKTCEIKAAGIEVLGVKADAVYAKATGAEVPIQKVHSYDAMGSWSLKLSKGVKFPDPRLVPEKEPPSVLQPFEPVIIQVDDERDTAAFFPLLDQHSRCLVRGNTAGTGKTYLLVQYAKYTAERGKKTLFVVPGNLLAYNLRQKDHVEAVTWHKLIGVRPTEDGEEATKAINTQDYQLIVFDEIFTYTMRQQARIKDYMEKNRDMWDEQGNNTERKFFAAGDTFQNLPREKLDVPNPRAFYNDNMARLFPAHVDLRVNKRMDNEADRVRIETFKKDCFSLSRDEVAAKYFTRIYDAKATMGKAICFTNKEVDTVNSVLHNRKVAERKAQNESVHEHPGSPTYYIGMIMCCRSQLKSKGKIFYTNFEYRIEEITEWGAKLWDFNADQVDDSTTSELLEASFTQLQSHFKPNYAHTGHSSQGLTFDSAVTIYGHNNWHCTSEWLYVAGTRTRRLADVYYFRGEPQAHGKTESEFLNNVRKKIRSCLEADARAGRHYEPGTEMTEADVLKLLRTVKKDTPTEWHLTCPSCIRDMQIFYDNGDEAQYSIDRVDSTLAHVKGNIQIICLRCNKAKH